MTAAFLSAFMDSPEPPGFPVGCLWTTPKRSYTTRWDVTAALNEDVGAIGVDVALKYPKAVDQEGPSARFTDCAVLHNVKQSRPAVFHGLGLIR